ncbi:MAG: DNA starvation/stationary phase protection protein [Acidimicrobiales bacterium]
MAKSNGRNGASRTASVTFTVPGMQPEAAERVVALLGDRLLALIDLSLTLKHIHWNVVGPHFIAVHEMLDPQHAAVSNMIDDVAERIATLGGSPNGLPGHLVAARAWDDYAIGRDSAVTHLGALDQVYTGVISSHREAIEQVGELDPITEDLLIGQAGELEQLHWFVRAHLETVDGSLVTAGTATETGAAEAARR